MGSKKISLAWLPCLVVALLLQGSLFGSVSAAEDQWKELRCWPIDITSPTATVRCQNDADSGPYDVPIPRDFVFILSRWFKGGPVPPLRKDSIPGSGFLPIKLPSTISLHSVATRGTTSGSTTTSTTTTTTATTPTSSSTRSSTTPAPEIDRLVDLVNIEECCCSAPQTLQNLKDLVDEKELFPRVAKSIVLIKPREVGRAICRADVCDRTARLETRCQQKWKTVATNIYLRNSTSFSRDLVVEDGCECYFIQLATDLSKGQSDPGRLISEVGSVAVEASSTAKAPTTTSSNSVSSPFITTTSTLESTTSVRTTAFTLPIKTTEGSTTSLRTTASTPPTTTSSPPRDSLAVDSTIPEVGGTVSIKKLNDVASMLNSSMLALLSVVSRMFSLMGASQNVRNAKEMARKLQETADVIAIAAKQLLEVNESSASDEDSSSNGDLIQLLLGSKYIGTTTTTLTISTCLATGASFDETSFLTSTESDSETSKIFSITTVPSNIFSITTVPSKIFSITTVPSKISSTDTLTSKISSTDTLTSKLSSTNTIARGTYYVTLTTFVTSTYVNIETLLAGPTETTVSKSELESLPAVSNLANVGASSKYFPPITDLVQNYVTISSSWFSLTQTILVQPKPSKSVLDSFSPDPKEEKVSIGKDVSSKVFPTTSLQPQSSLRTSLPGGTTSVNIALVPETSAFALHSESDAVATNLKTPRLSTNIDGTSTKLKTATTSSFITGFTVVTLVQLTPTSITQRSISPDLISPTFTGPTPTLSNIGDSARPQLISDITSGATKTFSERPDSISGAAVISVSSSQPTSTPTLLFPSPTKTAAVTKTEVKQTAPLPSQGTISVTTSLTTILTTQSSSVGDQPAALSQSSLGPANSTKNQTLEFGSFSGANRIGELFTLAEKLKECLVNQTHPGQHSISTLGAEDFLSKPLEQQMLLMPLWREFAKNTILEDLGSSDTAGCLAELKYSLPLSKVSPNLATGLKSIPKVSGLLIAVFEMTDCVNLRTRCKALVGEDLRRRLAASQAIEKIFTESESSLVSKIYLVEEIERAVEWGRYGSEDLITSFPVDTLGILYAYQSKLKPLLESYQRFCLSQITSSAQNLLANTSVVLSNGATGSASDINNSVLDSTQKQIPLSQSTTSSIAGKDPDVTLSISTSTSKNFSPTLTQVLQDSPVSATTSVTRSVLSVFPTASVQLGTTSKPRPLGISDLNLPKQFFPVSLSPDALQKLLFRSL